MPQKVLTGAREPSETKIRKPLKILAGVGQGRVLLADGLFDHQPGGFVVPAALKNRANGEELLGVGFGHGDRPNHRSQGHNAGSVHVLGDRELPHGFRVLRLELGLLFGDTKIKK